MIGPMRLVLAGLAMLACVTSAAIGVSAEAAPPPAEAEHRAAGGEHYAIRTRPWVAVAPATKKKDALTIGAPAAGGAIVGGILGGKKGAGIGALAGGGGGTAVVLTTRGKDVRVGRGATLPVRLSTPVIVRLSSRT